MYVYVQKKLTHLCKLYSGAGLPSKIAVVLQIILRFKVSKEKLFPSVDECVVKQCQTLHIHHFAPPTKGTISNKYIFEWKVTLNPCRLYILNGNRTHGLVFAGVHYHLTEAWPIMWGVWLNWVMDKSGRLWHSCTKTVLIDINDSPDNSRAVMAATKLTSTYCHWYSTVLITPCWGQI